jgi:protein-tyrosine phosphatase
VRSRAAPAMIGDGPCGAAAMSYRRGGAPPASSAGGRPRGAPVTQQVPSTEPELSGVRNFRDVGGLPAVDGRRVRHGVLFRSGHLAHATGEDAAFLASLGLRTVFDLRNAADQKLEGADVALPGVRNVNIPLTDPADGAEFWKMVRDGDIDELRRVLGDGGAGARMAAIYREIVRERGADIGRVLRAVSEGGVPALVHCAAGKDRAGMTVALTLLAVGVERDAIVADYLESSAPHRRYRVRRADGDAPGPRTSEAMALLEPLFEARTAYLDAAFDEMERGWGGFDGYLAEALGVTPEVRERLRDTLLD